MSALYNFDSFFRAFVLFICAATIAKRKFPSFFGKKDGMASGFYKGAVAGERLSIYFSILCVLFGMIKFVKFFI